MTNLWSLINGNKTYIFIALFAATIVAQAFGVIDHSTANQIYPLLGAGAGASFRHAISKLQEALSDASSGTPL